MSGPSSPPIKTETLQESPNDVYDTPTQGPANHTTLPGPSHSNGTLQESLPNGDLKHENGVNDDSNLAEDPPPNGIDNGVMGMIYRKVSQGFAFLGGKMDDMNREITRKIDDTNREVKRKTDDTNRDVKSLGQSFNRFETNFTQQGDRDLESRRQQDRDLEKLRQQVHELEKNIMKKLDTILTQQDQSRNDFATRLENDQNGLAQNSSTLKRHEVCAKL
ncbi:hypothetical protein M011DRAFT_189841 [Sporormia fimetaria CBS 119925]|uniref:Uncharacterized protein n=1 Tax=Sporormia fimetaria CBS 119925 TaxID=1340428 RepID=A0A6A6VK44_9PLEO|nr:hypothetical protein M011DRAFT_189841 [Sporormia fimetaria CBS 119925]